MNLQVMPKDALVEWVELLRVQYRVVGPKRKADHHVFGDIQSAAELDLSYSSTILPPKKMLLPQREDLFAFQDNGRRLEPIWENRQTVILGVHTCDLHAITLLDQASSQGVADQHYWSRRQNITLASIECLRPCSEDAFCKDMGTLAVPEAFDLHLTDLGQAYAIDIGSEKGAALLQGLTALRPATDDDYRQFNQVISAKWPNFPYRLEADLSELPSLLSVGYRSFIWEEIGEQCLGCGSCTIVCPTCYCFDVVDEVDFSLAAGTRLRVWDSCQLSDFAGVAGGHDFRSTQASRQRHRFCHKFKYQVEAFGQAGCVGCGRCAETCLVHIKPVDVLNKLYRKRVATSEKRQEVAL